MEAIITTSTDLQLQAVSIDSEVGEQEQMTSARAIANQSFDFSGLNTPDSLIATPASTVFLAIDSLDNEQLEQIESNTSSTASVVNEKDEEGANHRDMGEQEGVSERDEAEKEGSGHKEEEADDEEVETAVIDADPGTFASVSRALALAEMYRLARLLNVEIIEPPSGRGDTSLFIAKLPLEIRQMVYELLLVNPILGGIASISKYQDYGANSKYDLYPAILGVNRQVWEEASHTLYTVNNFFMVCIPAPKPSSNVRRRVNLSPLTRYFDSSSESFPILRDMTSFSKVAKCKVVTSAWAWDDYESLPSWSFFETCRAISRGLLILLEVVIILKESRMESLSIRIWPRLLLRSNYCVALEPTMTLPEENSRFGTLPISKFQTLLIRTRMHWSLFPKWMNMLLSRSN